MSADPKFSEDRRQGIGSSDIAAVLGLNPYRTAYDVFLEKTGKAPPWEGNESTKWGKLLERPIVEEYMEREGIPASEVLMCFDKSFVHPERKWQRATPDAVCRPRGSVIEAKNVGVRQAKRWGPGSDEVPIEYHLQGLWQLSVLDLERVHYAALFGGNEFEVYSVARDRELEGEVVGMAEKWWAEHVVKDEPPQLTQATEGVARYIKTRFARDAGTVREATSEEIQLAEALRQARKQKDGAIDVVDTLGARLKILMGEASKIEGPGFAISWKLNKGKQAYTVAAQEPSRVFRPTFEGE